MASVELTRQAVDQLDRLADAHGLPADARHRVRASMRTLEQFPLAGRKLSGEWAGYRVWIGPWRWLIFVY